MLAFKCIFISLIAISVLCSFLGHAQINPAQIATNAVLCFNNKFVTINSYSMEIYTGCDEEYRLNHSGDLHVPCEAANQFCYGPCLSETRTMLKCLDSLASGFIFLNKATTQIIRDALHSGCSYTPQRGLFILGNDLPSGTCNLISSAPAVGSQYVIAFIMVFCSLFFIFEKF